MPHLPALDGLRAIAILAVLAYHSGLLSGGFIGVDLFFALSGFLITRLLIAEHAAEGDLRLSHFWARRALRLVPALVAALVLAVAVSRRIEMPLEPGWAAAALLYASNLLIGWAHVYPIGLVSHTWSLAMEEQFYLLWPPIVALGLRRGLRPVLGAAVLLSLGPALARLAYCTVHPGDPYRDPTLWLRIYFAPEMRFDAIALGCLAAVILARRSVPDGSSARAVVAAAGVAGLSWLGFVALRGDIGMLVAQPLLFSVTALAATAVVVAAVRVPAFAIPLGARPFVWLGRISYGLYLYHVIVFVGLAEKPLAVRWGVALGLAAASWWVLERPILALKRRFARPGTAGPLR